MSHFTRAPGFSAEWSNRPQVANAMQKMRESSNSSPNMRFSSRRVPAARRRAQLLIGYYSLVRVASGYTRCDITPPVGLSLRSRSDRRSDTPW